MRGARPHRRAFDPKLSTPTGAILRSATFEEALCPTTPKTSRRSFTRDVTPEPELQSQEPDRDMGV